MKLYEIAFTPDLRHEPDATTVTLVFENASLAQDKDLVHKYFSSSTKARRIANLLLKSALDHFKQSHSIDRWADLEWEEKVVLSEIHTANVTTKELILLMANSPVVRAGKSARWMERRITLKVWTPKTKWTTPELAAKAYPKEAYRISECSLDNDGPITLEEVGISLVSESEWEPGSVRIEYQGESYTLLADNQLADVNWDSGLTSLGGGAVGRLLERPDVSRAFEKALHHYAAKQEELVEKG